MNTSTLIQRVWNFCHTLRDDGVSYGDYLEQLTHLLFLKMAHEYAQPPYQRDTHIPAGHDWSALRSKTGEPLEAQYLATLHRLGQQPGMLGAIFFKAFARVQRGGRGQLQAEPDSLEVAHRMTRLQSAAQRRRVDRLVARAQRIARQRLLVALLHRLDGEMGDQRLPAAGAERLDDDVRIHERNLAALDGAALTGRTAP